MIHLPKFGVLLMILSISLPLVSARGEDRSSQNIARADLLGKQAKDLSQAIKAVQRITAGQPGWAEYLELELLRNETQSIGAEHIPLLEKTIKRLTQDSPGLTKLEMVDLRSRCQNVCETLRRESVGKPELFSLAGKAAVMSLDSQDPTMISKASSAWRWLEDHGRRDKVGKEALGLDPNLIFQISKEATGLGKRNESTNEPVSGRLRGVSYRGHAQTNRSVTVTPLVSEQSALFGVNVSGRSIVSTSGGSDGVSVRSQATFDFGARALLRLTDAGWSGRVESSNGNFASQPTSISVSRNVLFKNIRRDRAREEHRAGIGEAKRQAMTQLRDDLSMEVRSIVDSLNRSLEQVKDRLLRINHAPLIEQFSSDSSGLTGNFRITSAAPQKVSPLPNSLCGVASLRIHETAFNSLVSMSLPHGLTKLSRLEQRLAFAGMRDHATSTEPLTIELPFRHSAECYFRDGKIAVVLHCYGLSTEQATLAETDIRVLLEPRKDGTLRKVGKVVLGNSSAFPPAAKAGLRGLSTRRVIGNLIDQRFPNTIDIADVLKNVLSKTPLASSRISHIESNDGWLTVVWDQ